MELRSQVEELQRTLQEQDSKTEDVSGGGGVTGVREGSGRG